MYSRDTMVMKEVASTYWKSGEPKELQQAFDKPAKS